MITNNVDSSKVPTPGDTKVNRSANMSITLSERYISPFHLLITLVIIIFLTEIMVMLIIPFLPSLSTLMVALIDSTLLVILIYPILYLIFFRPLRRHISARKQAVEALQQSEARYRSLTDDVLDTSAVGIFILDSDFRIVWINQALERFFDLKRSEIIGENKRDLIRNRIKYVFEDPDGFEKKVIATYDNNTYIENFECHVVPDGNRKESWLEHWSQPITTGLYSGGRIEHYYNITERKRIEEKLKVSDLKFRSLAEQSPNMIFINTLNGIVYVNKKCEEDMGYTKEEFYAPDFDFLTLIAPESQDSVKANLRKQFTGERVQPYELTLLTRAGIRIDGINSTKRINYNGVEAILGIITDITKRKKAEEELKKYHNHLEELVEERTIELRNTQKELLSKERLAVVGKLTKGIAREIRNPLGVIDSSVYVLKNMLLDRDVKAKLHLDRIKNQISISTAIIDSLQYLSEMEDPQKNKIDIVNPINAGLEISKIPESIDVIQKIPVGKFLVNADWEQLSTVFNNIVINAVQAIDKKGTLLITAETTSDGNIEVSFRDNGSGIAPEDMEKIFQPFFSTKAKGIGFGLVICEMIIDKHGGSIEARSEPGKGATFIVRLPLASTEKNSGK